MISSTRARVLSLVAFLEARDRQLELSFSGDCGDDDRREGGRFAPGNDCGGDGSGGDNEGPQPSRAVTGRGSRTTANSFPSAWRGSDPIDHDGGIPGADKIKKLEVNNPKAARKHARDAGVKSVAELLRIGTAIGDGAKVSVYHDKGYRWFPDGGKEATTTKIDADTPIEGVGQAETSVTLISVGEDDPFVYYDYFQVSEPVKTAILREKSDTGSSPTERKVGAAIVDQMLESLAAADGAGIKKAKTSAAGSATDSTYKGYRLWGRFGFDGTITSADRIGAKLLAEIISSDDDDHGLLTPEQSLKFQSTGSISLQELLSSKRGEKWWAKNGGSINLTLDFTDKDSLGYKRFRDFLDKHRRAKKREGRDYLDFIDFVCRSEVSRDLMEWPGFRGVEKRAACEKDDDGRFAKGNDCGGKGGGSSSNDKPLDASDPEAVKAFIAKMQKETGLDIHGRPTPKGSPRPNVDPQSKPKSLHQQRLEAAGKWSDSEGAEKNRKKQAAFQERLNYHDDIDPLKDLLRSTGVGWGAYANKANEHVRKTKGLTRKGFNRQAAQAASQGAESLARFLDEAGLVDLAEKLRRNREQRNCGTGTGGFQKGNTCAGQAAADVAKGAAKGAVVGAAAAVGKTGGFPPAVAAGAASGAAIGAVKGLYDNRMRPTRAGKAIKRIGTSDEQVASLVKGLGGSPKSVAEADGKDAVTLSIKDSKGSPQYDVRMTKSSVRIKPASGRQNLTSKDIKQIKKIAQENAPKSVEVSVDAVPTPVLAKMVKAGASLAVDAAGALVAAFVVPSAPAIAGTVIEGATGMEIEKTKAAQWAGEKILGNLPKRRG